MRTNCFRLVRTSCLAGLAVASSTLTAADENRRNANDTVVQMKPFKVMAAWMHIRPMLGQDHRVQYITITHVTPRSPADAAGIKAGSILVSLQGVTFSGLTLSELDYAFLTMRAGRALELVVAGPPKRATGDLTNVRSLRLAMEKTPAITLDWAGHVLP